ncbi:MAG: hypothetical protein HY812_07865 [Planctomycetes bacterium]|nr:hypothetical protein [Planctomycetota bacterium]
MKTSMKTLTLFALASLIVGFAGAERATAKGGVSFSASVHLGGVHIGASSGYGVYGPPMWPARPVCVAPVWPAYPVYVAPVHGHTYRIVTERVWIQPVYRRQLIGYDFCGRPMYRRVCVQPGHWGCARYQVGCCGQRTFLGW